MTLFIAIMWFCGAIFIGIGIFSFKKKNLCIWAGTKVKSNEITDIKAYNRTNGIMWTIYGVFLFCQEYSHCLTWG